MPEFTLNTRLCLPETLIVKADSHVCATLYVSIRLHYEVYILQGQSDADMKY